MNIQSRIFRARQYDVVGVGNALMDFLSHVSEETFLELGIGKGDMHLVELDHARKILQQIGSTNGTRTIPGGSAANTVRAVSHLGGATILYGAVGDDLHGANYATEMVARRVMPRLSTHSQITGHCVTAITPDQERSFAVHLGAALKLRKDDIQEDDIAQSNILHLEGYILEGDTLETVQRALDLAKKHNTYVSVDLGAPGVITRNKDIISTMIREYVNILFVNEEEAQALTGHDNPRESFTELSDLCDIVVVKLGKKGSLISYNNTTFEIPIFPVDAIDTTGAGDSYAAGLLYGLSFGWHVEKAGLLGSLLASKIVSVLGVQYHLFDAVELKEGIN